MAGASPADPELRAFFKSVHVIACEVADGDLVIGLVGGDDGLLERRQLHAYLDTWLGRYGDGVTATVDCAGPTL